MSVTGECQVTCGNGKGPIRLKGVDMVWIWEVFGPLITVGS